MEYKRFYIWIEGGDDEKFFRRVVKPPLVRKYDSVEFIRYANLKKEKIDSYLKSIHSMNADYLFIADINRSPCVTEKRNKINEKFNGIEKEKIIVVVPEIEGWFLAGLDEKSTKKLKIPSFDNTQEVTKEKFDKLIPNRFDSRIDFMLEILKFFSIDVAKEKNSSFAYFVKKYL